MNKCKYCGTKLQHASVCSNCGMKLKLVRKLLRQTKHLREQTISESAIDMSGCEECVHREPCKHAAEMFIGEGYEVKFEKNCKYFLSTKR